MKITAAVLHQSPVAAPYAQTQPLRIEELELAPPQVGEVLVEVKAAGLCHSDLSVINGDRPRPVPMALGHEAAGIVREIGPNVSRFKPGDHVVMVFVPSCGHCIPCAEGRPALCEPGNAANGRGELIGGGRRLSLKAEPVQHHVGVSAFATHAVLSENSLVKIDDSVPFEIAALFGCAVLTGVGAVINSGAVRPGQSVAVVGLGGVGLSALLGAVAAGAHPIVAVDLSPEKLAFAKELGATHCFDARDEGLAAAVKQATDGGVHVAIELAGSVRALETAFAITRRGGLTVTAGLANPAHNFAFPPVRLVGEELTLRGSYVGSCVPVRDIPRFITLYKSGDLPVNKLLTSRSDLNGINAALDQLAQGKTVRHVITF
ncbi:zinc-dependent alcohol dehydrogenase family protein [Acidocella sp.]|uniref:zinc-dependent alcohol dehydrogenase family protein n=1 Tax=Acidocella sp. TaxID=50710 RepID=UPI0026175799|nr:zinc-dependent alcohol dehydrogenase family protein [Acidocella sp.]